MKTQLTFSKYIIDNSNNFKTDFYNIVLNYNEGIVNIDDIELEYLEKYLLNSDKLNRNILDMINLDFDKYKRHHKSKKLLNKMIKKHTYEFKLNILNCLKNKFKFISIDIREHDFTYTTDCIYPTLYKFNILNIYVIQDYDENRNKTINFINKTLYNKLKKEKVKKLKYQVTLLQNIYNESHYYV